MKGLSLRVLAVLFLPLVLQAQNVGVGTTTPSEKLEVAGKIFTNEGGIKFPDNTLQTTAAYNQSMPGDAYAIPKGIGFVDFSPADLDGPLDTIDLTHLSIVYGIDMDAIHDPGGPILIDHIDILKQTDLASPGIFKYLMLSTLIPTCDLYLTQVNSSGDQVAYFQIKLQDAKISEFHQTLKAGLGGDYVHTENIKLVFNKISVKELPSGFCYCWNLVTNSSCSCF